MSPRKPFFLMPNYGPKAFLCMTTPLFVESIANCKEVSFFAIQLLQILNLDLIFFDQEGGEEQKLNGDEKWHRLIFLKKQA